MPAPSVDSDLIRELAKLLEETGLNEVEVSEGDRRIRVARAAPTVAAWAPPPTGPVGATAGEAAAPEHPGALKSPMVGTVYVASSPGATPFVKVGDEVAAGQTLLIIEAMKVMNAIPAPRAGRISRILVSDGQPVEYDEILLLLE